MLSGGLVHRSRKPGVSLPSATAFGDHESLPVFRNVDQLSAHVRIKNYGADRHGQFDIVTCTTRAVTSLAVTTALGRMLRIKAEVQQCVVVRVPDDHDVTARAAVATARAASGDVFFTPKGQAAIAAVPGFYSDSYFVDKHVEKRKGRAGVIPAATVSLPGEKDY
jgi:hypothetical protein